MKRFWDAREALAGRLAAKRLLVTLDFDGTLAPLARTPAAARLKPEFRSALRSLAGQPGVSVFILSGRAMRDVRALVGLKKLYYGGNHGIEAAGPGFEYKDPRSGKARAVLAALAAGLLARFPPDTGALIEDKLHSVSVHYRNLRKDLSAAFFRHMKEVMSSGRGLRWRRGHKVFEALPPRSSDKGGAALRLRARLGRPLTVAVGDDLTDEDMFLALKGRGITVRVGRKRGSHAGYYLERQAEVLRLLRFLVRVRKGGIR